MSSVTVHRFVIYFIPLFLVVDSYVMYRSSAGIKKGYEDNLALIEKRYNAFEAKSRVTIIEPVNQLRSMLVTNSLSLYHTIESIKSNNTAKVGTAVESKNSDPIEFFKDCLVFERLHFFDLDGARCLTFDGGRSVLVIGDYFLGHRIVDITGDFCLLDNNFVVTNERNKFKKQGGGK